MSGHLLQKFVVIVLRDALRLDSRLPLLVDQGAFGACVVGLHSVATVARQLEVHFMVRCVE